MKKYFILLLIIAVLVGLTAYGVLFFKERTKEAQVRSFEDCAAGGYPIAESYPRQCITSAGRVFSEDIGNELEKSDLIKISNPRPNQIVSTPLEIAGEARGFWFFEASFPIKLFDGNGNLLAIAVAQAQGEWMTENFVPFKAEIRFDKPSTEKGWLILEKDNPSGLPENADELRVPVKFDLSQKVSKVKVFFNNSKLDPEFSCNKVFATERTIPETAAVARAALEELLAGPTQLEIGQGFSTSINSGVIIQKLTIENGVAKADFNGQLEFQVGGSCRVAAIRAQIAETLKQFPSVKEVVVSIDGRTEDILQP